NLCILCGTCTSVCASGAITIPFDGTYRLETDEDKCTACGKCLAACPGLRVKNYEPGEEGTKENYYLGAFHHVYSGYSTDFLRRYRSSSGGLVTETLFYLLENKIVDAAVLTRFSSSSPLQPEGFIARTREDVISAVGSKYSPVPLNVLLRDLDLSKKYAYVGLPCHLLGLKFFLKQHREKNSRNFFTLGLFCSRTNRLRATKFLLRYNRFPLEQLKGIRYRGTGHPGFFSITGKTGEEKKIYHLDETYWGLLFKKYFMQYRCWLCPDKSAFFCDLSFADDWSRSFYEDKAGTSIVVARSKRGLDILQEMMAKETVVLEEVDAGQVSRDESMPYKMNILKRLKIAGFFHKPVPQYENFD
ncbi:MAG: 4Fe-4S dicluster domain-containing protein, partial [bacterium]|nr:4Fe-4S dicluster domain-containing protein [bacterium]